MADGLEELDELTCWRLAGSVAVGRIGFQVDSRPMVLPVNHIVDDESIVFLTGEGAKWTAAVLRRPVVFEADDWSPSHRSGWSILVHGTAHAVTEGPRLERLSDLDLEPWAGPDGRHHWVRIRPEAVTGRFVRSRG